jgi:predicted ATPase/DNA-binding CsgD family transcriptional regulator
MMGDFQPSRLPEPFNQREVDILCLIKQGLTNQEIARKLYLSLDTIKWYNQKIFAKLGVNNRTQAIEKAQEYGLIEPQAAASAKPIPHPEHNLPARPNSFIGRKKELASLRRLLQARDIRLVTIVGPSGVGKTRLSLELAHQLASNFRDGAFFISLAPLNDPALVASAIAHVFGIRETSGRPLQEILADSLRERQLLLLLDNFEHLLSAASLVSELLAAASGLKILATSRAPLRVYGEQLFPLPPLSVPDPENLTYPDTLLQFEGTRLFIERVRAVKPDFVLSAEQAAPVAKICHRLDGLPLALELAAARTRTLSPAVMAAQFDGREGRFPFPMLAKGPRDAPARHHTLHSAIAWSYDLLPADEQAVFRRLGVFYGGCTREAAEVVCQGSLLALESLVDMNLLIQSDVEGERRFGILEMIRAFALEQLGLSGEEDTYRKRHAEYYLALALDCDLKLNSLREPAWIHVLERERDNLRTVLAWGLSPNDFASLKARVKAVHTCLGQMHLPLSEQRQWTEKALSRLLEISPPALDREQSLFLSDLMAMAGNTAYFQGDYAAARALLERGQAIIRAMGDKWRLAGTLTVTCWTLLALGEEDSAKASAEEVLSLRHKIEDAEMIGNALTHLGYLAGLRRDFDQAESLYAESLVLFREAQKHWWVANSLLNKGQMMQERNEQARAREIYREGLVVSYNLGDISMFGQSLEKAARSAAAYGQLRQAALLFAAADALFQSTGYVLEVPERPGHEKYLSLVRNGLDPVEFTAAWAEGQALTPEQALAEAREALA